MTSPSTTANTTSRSRSQNDSLLFRILDNQRTRPMVIAGLAVLLSLLAISLIIIIIGKNPLTVFASLLQGSGMLPKPRYAGGKSMLTDFMGFLDAMTPMLFAAIAVSIAFKAGLFNIGISGQMLLSGFLATVFVGYSSLGAVAAKPLVLLVGVFAGAALAIAVGWLKVRFNIHEVVSTIMLNYIVQYVVSYFVKRFYIDPVSRQSVVVSAESRLTLTNVQVGGVQTRIPLCFLLAVLCAVAFYIIINRTSLGFEIRAVGLNRRAAEYAGISANRTIMLAMALSGAAAGLAGVTFYLGYFNSIMPNELTRVGFDSIAVAMLANSDPLACLLSSMLITSFDYGSIYMSSTSGISTYIASLLIGIVLLFSASSGYFNHLINRRSQALETGEYESEDGDGAPAPQLPLDDTAPAPTPSTPPVEPLKTLDKTSERDLGG